MYVMKKVSDDNSEEKNIDRKIEKHEQNWKKKFNKGIADMGFKSQDEFAKAFKEKYHTRCSQRNVSRWTRVGEIENINNENKRIGFPSYHNMIMIADFLGVDVAYLTGEITAETYDCQKVSDYTGLDSDAITALKEMTNPTNDSHSSLISDIAKQNRIVLNKMLVQKEFQSFIEALTELDKTYNKPDRSAEIWNELEKKYGEETVKQAYDLYNSPIDILSNDNAKYPEEVINAYRDIDSSIDEIIKLQDHRKKDIAIEKYALWESFESLIAHMYP